MRAKDRQRLDVVKSLLAEITNASKTSAPADTDIAILQIINKTKSKAQDSIQEARKAGREDIVEKEKVGITFLEEYASKVNSMSPEQIRAVVEKVVASMGKDDKGNPPGMGQVLKNVMLELEGEPVLRADVAQTVKQYLKEVRN